MNLIMVLILVGYVVLVIVCANRVSAELEEEVYSQLRLADKDFQELENKRTQLNKYRNDLQEKALEIFTLYEITKDITKNLKDQEAFDVFKRKLQDHVFFKECSLFGPLSKDVRQLRKSDDHFVFKLKGKKKSIGYLVVEGVSDEDKEKVVILGGQFALALRRVKLYEEIEQIATTDSLTGLHTRRYIMDRFKEEFDRSKKRKIGMSFLMIDVDFFKTFNDKYGHLTGDQILREVGLIVRESIREIDIAGRYGGEEFCVILPDTDRAGALLAAERIRLVVEKTVIKAYDAVVNATVSVGSSTFPEDAKNIDELIDRADWALYRAKKQGRNRVCSFGVYSDT